MSTSPYSLDLRKKVIEYINKGNSQQSASRIFNIHISTVYRWVSRNKAEGHCKAKPRLGRKRTLSYKDVEEFIINNPNSKLYEIGKKFKISAWHSGRILKKLGFSYKKKTSPMWKQMKKEEKSTKKL